MCYGTCSLESYMGGCSVLSSIEQIRKELGFNPCFIGGAVTCPEEDEYYQELLKEGKISKMKKRVYEIQERYKIK